jgi:hypothetical protein
MGATPFPLGDGPRFGSGGTLWWGALARPIGLLVPLTMTMGTVQSGWSVASFPGDQLHLQHRESVGAGEHAEQQRYPDAQLHLERDGSGIGHEPGEWDRNLHL